MFSLSLVRIRYWPITKTITQLKGGCYQGIKNQFIQLKANLLPQEIEESKNTNVLDILIDTYSDNLHPDKEKNIAEISLLKSPLGLDNVRLNPQDVFFLIRE